MTSSSPPDSSAHLRVRDLTIAFPRSQGLALAANRVNFDVKAGSTLGIIGESGSGKSVTLRALLGLVPAPGEVIAGEIEWGGRDLRTLGGKKMEALRGSEISMVFQDPAASLNPVFSIGDQVEETLRVKLGIRRAAARERTLELLERVGIPSAAKRIDDYPHQLSGGMRQRVMIAMAIACQPKLLLADEPTTALDVTIQDQILSLLMDLQEETGMAMIIVSHDLGVISGVCDEIAVMYAGHIVEVGHRDDVIATPAHPYTRALLRTAPSMEPARGPVYAIPGQLPDLARLPAGCPFAPRCEQAREECAEVPMTLQALTPAHASACPFMGLVRA